MKFGRMLRTTAEDLPEMESLFVSYKQLKKQLKRLPYRPPLEEQQQQQPPQGGGGGGAGPSAMTAAAIARAQAPLSEEENGFVAALTDTLTQMNDIFLEKEENSVIKVEALEQRLGAAGGASADDLGMLHKAFVDFHGEVLLLVHWSIMAYTATVKILKKHHKRTGLLVRAPQLGDLLSQPFCSTELMTGIAHRVEDDIAALATRAGLQPHAPGGSSGAGVLPDSVGGAARVASAAGQLLRAELGGGSVAQSSTLSNHGLDLQLLQRLADSDSSSDQHGDGGDDTEDDAAGGSEAAYASGATAWALAGVAGASPAKAAGKRPLAAAGGADAATSKRPRPADAAGAGPSCNTLAGAEGAAAAGAPEAGQQPPQHGASQLPLVLPAESVNPTSQHGAAVDAGGDAEDEAQAEAVAVGSPHLPATSQQQPQQGERQEQNPVPANGHEEDAEALMGPPVARQGSILRQTQVALTTWQHLKSSASTPSTVIAHPPGELQPGARAAASTARSQSSAA